jgi:hypothetical protein
MRSVRRPLFLSRCASRSSFQIKVVMLLFRRKRIILYTSQQATCFDLGTKIEPYKKLVKNVAGLKKKVSRPKKRNSGDDFIHF